MPFGIYRLESRERTVSQPTTHELQNYLKAAENIVQESTALVLSFDPSGISTRAKPDGSPVTEVDFAVEDLIRSRLKSTFPDHGILGEERTEIASHSGFQWIIDPIDGTRSFSHRIPLYGTLLALRHEGRSVVGAIALPALNLTYVGALGLGAYRNGKRIQMSAVEPPLPIEHEIIAIGDRRQFVSCGQTAVFDSLMHSAPTVRTYCDCFGHALAIDGSVGAMVDYGVCVWDMAATEILVREAGGQFAHVSTGAPGTHTNPRYDVVFGKSHVVDWVLERIGGQTEP